MKAHKVMVEALWRLYWEEFIKWVKAEDYEWRLEPLVNALNEMYSEFDCDLQSIDKNRINEKLEVCI